MSQPRGLACERNAAPHDAGLISPLHAGHDGAFKATTSVLIVDFGNGSQVTQLIARRVRESGVYCEIHPYDRVEALLEDFAPKAVILSGGPASAHEAESSPPRRPRSSSLACRCWGSATAR